MSNPLGDWRQEDRQRFWSFIRGRMAVLRLSQERVATALGIDRSVLSRRLTGDVIERPSQQMVDQLGKVLRLDGDATTELLALAGYAEAASSSQPEELERPRETAPPSSPSASGPIPVPTRSSRKALALGLAVLAVAFTVVLVMLAVRSSPSNSGSPVASSASVVPGGVWVGPDNEASQTGQVHFAARAYATNPGEPAIAYVEFTVSWEGRPGPWVVACVQPSTVAGRYECDWKPTADVPFGMLRISFDVYDRANPPHVNRAPEGTRTITYSR